MPTLALVLTPQLCCLCRWLIGIARDQGDIDVAHMLLAHSSSALKWSFPLTQSSVKRLSMICASLMCTRWFGCPMSEGMKVWPVKWISSTRAAPCSKRQTTEAGCSAGYLGLGAYFDGANVQGLRLRQTQPVVMRFDPKVRFHLPNLLPLLESL